MDLTTAPLSLEHSEELHVASAINPEVVTARGYRTLTGSGADRDELAELGFLPYVHARDDAYPGLLIPMHGASGEVRGHQFKPAVPRTRTRHDKAPAPIKYETPKGHPIVVDVPEYTRSVLADLGIALWITEGMKKTDALVSQGAAALGLTGVFNWRNSYGTLGDWEDIPLKGRPVVICFDADANGNRSVQLAMSRLGAWVRSKGASAVYFVVVPATVEGTEVKGVDDYFAAGGTLTGLHEVATQTAPGAGEKDAGFTDAFLVVELAEAMGDRYCWAAGLGWLRWTGTVWRAVSDVEPLEAVRVWAADQFDRVLSQQRSEPSKNLGAQIMGWRAILGKSRLTALRDLLRGLVQRDAAEFDGDPDLLTVLNGTVHLPSGKLMPFDPAHSITKTANAEYRRGYTHPSWTAALGAIPGDMQEWFRDRLGQGCTGYPVPDHLLVIAHGTGSNGKSLIYSVVRRTLGDHATMVSDRVLLANPGDHPTELMDLRGARMALLEETPEARQLNVQRLKMIFGTESIKARHIRQDTVEFLTSHSLFITTNYRPNVVETDHGTWRRLSLMPWPFTFRKPGEALEGPWDRVGDPALAYAANDPEVRTAALAWMVEGARDWYARGRMMLPVPERVERETRAWRSDTDLILGFADERLTFEREAFTQTSAMLAAFNEWTADRGHRPWNDRTFASRFGAHETVRGAQVQQGRFSVGGKQQRGWSGVKLRTDGVNPFTGDVEAPPAPEPEYPGQDGRLVYDDGGSVVGLDQPERECWCCARIGCDGCGPQAESFGQCPNCRGAGCRHCDINRPASLPETSPTQVSAPVILGFDLETAEAEQLFIGGHDGPFCRLGGTAQAPENTTDMDLLVDGLMCADVIYGHNIFGFDLPALAHHHGADYDALAAKAVDTMVLARLVDPPMSKHMPNGYYGLDQVAQRLGHEGKTDDLKALAKRHGGFDQIPLDDAEYHAYLRGDLAATKHVYDRFLHERGGVLTAYAEREMRVVALQNRMTLNGWAVDTELLAERVTGEDAQRAAAVAELHAEYGMPLARPDRFKLKLKRDWPEGLWSWSVAEARANMLDDPDTALRQGYAERIPGEPYVSPWATDSGRQAIIDAFAAAGAEFYPTTKSGVLALSADAMGDKPWYDADRRKSVPGMMQAYRDNEAVGAVVDKVLRATGARAKYAEVQRYLTPAGRVHGVVSDAQGSGRWGTLRPALANMGKNGAAGRERDVMVAEPGHLLVTCDLSQVDLRAMAGLSQDPAYAEILQVGRDAHMEMALVYFGEQNAETRKKTKAFNHAGNYGQQPKAVSERTGIPLEKCYEIAGAKLQAYPRLAEYIEEIREEAASGRLLDNGFGRLMRPDPERAFTQGPALMGQGAARDIMCESLLRLVDRAPEVRPLLRGVVHDEVVLSVPEGDVPYWSEVLTDAFTWTWRDVPILCELGTPAYRWSGCK